MSTERKIIRKDIVTRLLGKTAAQARVFPSRDIPLPETQLPAITVTTKRERGESVSLGGEPNFRNTLTVLIEPIVSHVPNALADDVLDDLADEVTEALFTDPDWVKQFEKISYVESELHYIADGNKHFASVEMQFDLQYHLQYEPKIIDDFVTLRLDVDAIDPADPNVHPPDGTWPEGYGGQPGPDKRIEVAAELTLEQDP